MRGSERRVKDTGENRNQRRSSSRTSREPRRERGDREWGGASYGGRNSLEGPGDRDRDGGLSRGSRSHLGGGSVQEDRRRGWDDGKSPGAIQLQGTNKLSTDIWKC